ncbi:MAG: hypothetical protein QOD57_4054 [Actinomycetota bacterium]|jgi:hypothetical protein|nr:hypothetical protein [Actinomycetota bacterium]
MRMRTSALAVGLVSLLAAAGCSGGGGGNKNAGSTSPSSTAVSGGAVKDGPIAPLTGLVDQSGATASRPSIAVKVDNAPEARPQSGLDVADIVYEEVVEGGVTRFIAVFHSQAPPVAGPVRSVRPMDPGVLSAYHGLVAYSGGIPAFVALLRKAPVQDVDVDVATDAYTWDKSRAAPHNEYVSPEKLWPKAKGANAEPPKAMFVYRAAGEAFGDADAHHVVIPYSPRQTSVYDWDAAAGTWKRTSNGTPHTTASGAQIAPQNVVIQFVSLHNLDYVDQSGTKVVESTVIGSGDAWILSAGRMTKGHWSKDSASAPTRFTDGSGNPVKLTPGRTWVHFAPVGTPVTAG